MVYIGFLKLPFTCTIFNYIIPKKKKKKTLQIRLKPPFTPTRGLTSVVSRLHPLHTSVTTSISLLELPDHLCALAAFSVVQGAAAAASLGSWLEVQNLRHHYKPIKPESAFRQNP